jgi:hypothetical protein
VCVCVCERERERERERDSKSAGTGESRKTVELSFCLFPSDNPNQAPRFVCCVRLQARIHFTATSFCLLCASSECTTSFPISVKMQQTDEMQAIVLVALVYGQRQYDILKADNITSTGCSCCCGCC